MSRKKRDLQPWIDYFRLLRTYEEKEFLEVRPGKGDAYVTLSALAVLAFSDAAPEPGPAMRFGELSRTVVWIRAYAGWKCGAGARFLDAPFALNVVEDEGPHGLLCTVLVTRRRAWWKLWRKADRIDVVRYGRNEEGGGGHGG